jgi:hypothetical protein
LIWFHHFQIFHFIFFHILIFWWFLRTAKQQSFSTLFPDTIFSQDISSKSFSCQISVFSDYDYMPIIWASWFSPTNRKIKKKIFHIDRTVWVSCCIYHKNMIGNKFENKSLAYDIVHLKTNIVLEQPSRISIKLFFNFFRLLLRTLQY